MGAPKSDSNLLVQHWFFDSLAIIQKSSEENKGAASQKLGGHEMRPRQLVQPLIYRVGYTEVRALPWLCSVTGLMTICPGELPSHLGDKMLFLVTKVAKCVPPLSTCIV